jgi:hypothetical protein
MCGLPTEIDNGDSPIAIQFDLKNPNPESPNGFFTPIAIVKDFRINGLCSPQTADQIRVRGCWT